MHVIYKKGPLNNTQQVAGSSIMEGFVLLVIMLLVPFSVFGEFM